MGLLFALLLAVGHWFGVAREMGVLQAFSAPWVTLLGSGVIPLYLLYGARLLLGAMVGILLISPFLLRPLPWSRRVRLLSGLLAWALFPIFLPGFPILFALVFPFLLLAGGRRWVSRMAPGTLALVVVPSLLVLASVQMGSAFDPWLWVNPAAGMGDLSPNEYWKEQKLKRQVVQGADEGQLWALGPALHRTDLTPDQRLRYFRRMQPDLATQTPEREREYLELLWTCLQLPGDRDHLPPGFLFLLTHDPVLGDPKLNLAASRTRVRQLAIHWRMWHPDQPVSHLE